MRTSIFPLLCAALGALAAEHPPDKSLEVSFRPQDLPKKAASCKALNRATNELTDIDLGQCWRPRSQWRQLTTMHTEYVDVNPNAERTILMVHGWPSLWHSWKYQIEEFKVCSERIRALRGPTSN